MEDEDGNVRKAETPEELNNPGFYGVYELLDDGRSTFLGDFHTQIDAECCRDACLDVFLRHVGGEKPVTAEPTPSKPVVPQREGRCPECGESIDYGIFHPAEGNSCYYEWECASCDATGAEYYSMKFDEHVVRGKGNE